MRLSWRGFSALTAAVLLGLGAAAVWAQEGTTVAEQNLAGQRVVQGPVVSPVVGKDGW